MVTELGRIEKEHHDWEGIAEFMTAIYMGGILSRNYRVSFMEEKYGS